MTSHVSLSVLEIYRTASGQLDDNTVSLVEDHMMSCDECRSTLGGLTPTDEVDRSWAAIVGELELGAEDSIAGGRRRPLMLAAASIALIVVGVVALAVRREPPAPASTLPAGFVDLGSVDELTTGEVRWVEEHRLFLVRTDEKYVVLSQRSPTRGCRLVTGDELISGITIVGSGATFADPCHGATFALDGTRLSGPAARGMYSYRFELLDNRIIADLRLLVPGALAFPNLEDPAPPLPGPGIVDETSQAWLDAARAAVDPVLDGGPSLWPLGAFHDTAIDVVNVYMTVGWDYLQLQVGTPEALDALPDPQGHNVVRAHPDGTGRVVMLFFDNDDNDNEAELLANRVLLHIVEAFDEQP